MQGKRSSRPNTIDWLLGMVFSGPVLRKVYSVGNCHFGRRVGAGY